MNEVLKDCYGGCGFPSECCKCGLIECPNCGEWINEIDFEKMTYCENCDTTFMFGDDNESLEEVSDGHSIYMDR